MRRGLFLGLVLLPCLAMAGNGYLFDTFYIIDVVHGKLRAVEAPLDDNIYLYWSREKNTWIWRTGIDPRRILPGSKVQGSRLGLGGRAASRWYRLDDVDDGTWNKARDRERPCLLRQGSGETGVARECVPDGWEASSADLDPEAPSCLLTVEPSRVWLGESVLLSLKVQGAVTSAELDDEPVDLKVLKRIQTPASAGSQTARARIKGPGGDVTCSAQYEVLPH